MQTFNEPVDLTAKDIVKVMSMSFTATKNSNDWGNPVATIPTGYKFLTWVGILSDGWYGGGHGYFVPPTNASTEIYSDYQIPDYSSSLLNLTYLVIKDI